MLPVSIPLRHCRRHATLALTAALLLLTACGGSDGDSCGGIIEPVRVVTPSPASVQVDVGNSSQLTASLSGGCASDDRTVVWTSSNPLIATVDASGRVLGVSAGSAIVTATAFSDRARTTVPVTVRPRVATEFDVRPGVDTLSPQGTRALTVTVRDQNGTLIQSPPVSWRSLTPNVASVSAAGVITAIASGQASIEGATPRIGADSLRDTVNVLVVPACSLVRPVAFGSTITGQFDASTCQNQFGYRLVNQYSLTATTQTYYSIRLTPTTQASLATLNISGGVFGLPSADTAVTGLGVMRPGTFGFLVTAPTTAPGTYSVTTAIDPDPRLFCVPTDVTTGVTFRTAILPGCQSRDIRILPALTAGQQVRITASAAGFPVAIELRNASTSAVIRTATAAGAGAVATIAYTNTAAFPLVILKVTGGANVNDLVTVTIAQ
jgi:Bacterial Ig-like domain (group 2)